MTRAISQYWNICSHTRLCYRPIRYNIQCCNMSSLIGPAYVRIPRRWSFPCAVRHAPILSAVPCTLCDNIFINWCWQTACVWPTQTCSTEMHWIIGRRAHMHTSTRLNVAELCDMRHACSYKHVTHAFRHFTACGSHTNAYVFPDYTRTAGSCQSTHSTRVCFRHFSIINSREYPSEISKTLDFWFIWIRIYKYHSLENQKINILRKKRTLLNILIRVHQSRVFYCIWTKFLSILWSTCWKNNTFLVKAINSKWGLVYFRKICSSREPRPAILKIVPAYKMRRQRRISLRSRKKCEQHLYTCSFCVCALSSSTTALLWHMRCVMNARRVSARVVWVVVRLWLMGVNNRRKNGYLMRRVRERWVRFSSAD